MIDSQETALYCGLSREDEKVETSGSIETKKHIFDKNIKKV